MRWFDIADELLPPVYRAIKDMYAYAKSLDAESRNWLQYMERILNNFYIQTCDTQTLEYWEDLLGITINGTETSDERRETILAYLNNTNPITEPYVRSVIEDRFPGDNYTLHFDVENNNPYDLNIDIFTTDDSAMMKFRDWFWKMCPAHIRQTIAKAIPAEIEQDMVANYAQSFAIEFAIQGLSHTYTPPPERIIIGQTTTCDLAIVGLHSYYYWIYNFNNSSGSNWYNPLYYQNAVPPITDGTLQPVGGNRYEEVDMSDGAGVVFSPTTFRLAEYNSKPELYMDPGHSASNGTSAGVIVKLGSSLDQTQTFYLPNSLYSISSGHITWNQSHPLMILLGGKECFSGQPEPAPDPTPDPDPDPDPQPGPIYIGTTTTCPAGTSTLYTPYFWMYAFQNASGTNWFDPNYYESASPPYNNSNEYPVGGSIYSEVYLTDGIGGTYSPMTFALSTYNDRPEFYMDNMYEAMDSDRNGAVVVFGSAVSGYPFSFPLPYDMYSISGTTIIWNQSHPLMALLLGKECTTGGA